MNEVDKMIEEHGWVCDWNVPTAERVEKLIIEQRNLIHELSMKLDRLRDLAENIILSYDNGDKMAGWTIQEKYLAKEIIRVIEEESK